MSMKFVAQSHAVFNVLGGVPIRHEEMEYSIPLSVALKGGILAKFLSVCDKHRDVFFPQEIRFVKGDSFWLSSGYNSEPRVYFTVMQKAPGCDNAFFNEVEGTIFSPEPTSRPHWGKHHGLVRDDLSPRFEKWADWQRVRDTTDPQRVFTTPYIANVFGE